MRDTIGSADTQGGASAASSSYTVFIVEGEYPTWGAWLQHGKPSRTLKGAQELIAELRKINDRKYRIKEKTTIIKIL